MPTNCPKWEDAETDSKLPTVVAGLADFHRFAVRTSNSHILEHGDLKTWHEKIFKNAVPLPYYAGNYRSNNNAYPCLKKDVQVGGHLGAPYVDVPGLMREFSREIRNSIVQTDRYLASTPTPTKRACAIIQLAAFCMGRFLQIHPFLNGNGRMARLITNYIFRRYGYKFPFYNPYPRPRVDYPTASAACMIGDFRPMYKYLLTLLAS